jgi:membrane-bound lytic murein transglycosylase D
LIITASLLLSETTLFAWGLFNLFTDSGFNERDEQAMERFDSDRDILYLPESKDTDIFESSRDLSICRKKSIRKHIYLYLTSKREYLIRAIERSYNYEDLIIEIFNKNRDLPEELRLLPLLESCFNPGAVSSSRAVGLWQFVDNTARPLGLDRNRWLDERRSVVKSTEAALRHFRNIRGSFPDWALTLAAYNGGAGYVKRAIDKNNCKDFWKLSEGKFFREETSEYVPKFIALMILYKNQRLFGIGNDITKPEKMEIGHLTLRQAVDLRTVARLSGLPIQKIRELNPELISTMTPPEGRTYQLCVPVEAKKKLEEKSRELYKNKISGIIKHRIKRGETISKIARLYKKKSTAILRFNSIKNEKALMIGQIIYVPN